MPVPVADDRGALLFRLHLLCVRYVVALRRQPQKAAHDRFDALISSELLYRCREVAASVLPHLLEKKRELRNAVRRRVEFAEATQDRTACVVEMAGVQFCTHGVHLRRRFASLRMHHAHGQLGVSYLLLSGNFPGRAP